MFVNFAPKLRAFSNRKIPYWMAVVQRMFPLVLLSMFVSSCGGVGRTPTRAFVSDYGGSIQFSTTELACVDRHPELDAVLDTDLDLASLQLEASKVPKLMLECFGQRTVSALVSSETPIGGCWKKELLMSLTRSIEGGARYFGTSLGDSATTQKVLEKCGRLEARQ
jgi:hypothetical protein